MMKRLLPLLLAAVLLLGVAAPAETSTAGNDSAPAICPACAVSSANDPLFESNHAACEGCGIRNCQPESARKSHTLCSGCGLRKCSPEYKESAHRKCAGCRELLCISGRNHTSCPGCHRYICKDGDHYSEFNHAVNSYGRYLCLDYPEEELEESPEEVDEEKPDAQSDDDAASEPTSPPDDDASSEPTSQSDDNASSDTTPQPDTDNTPSSPPTTGAPDVEPSTTVTPQTELPAFICPAANCTDAYVSHSYWLGKCGQHYLCEKLPRYDEYLDYFPAVYERMHALNGCGHFSCSVYENGVALHYLYACNEHYECDATQLHADHGFYPCLLHNKCDTAQQYREHPTNGECKDIPAS